MFADRGFDWPSHLLMPDDRIVLGLNELICDLSPRWLAPMRYSHRAFFLVTCSDNRYYLPPKAEVILGRSDPNQGVTVDMDLSQEGKVAGEVSHCHVCVNQESGLHLVEDPGSAYRTKLNGTKLEVGELFPLHPGDHLCLGGCILYYDLEVQPAQETGIGLLHGLYGEWTRRGSGHIQAH